MATLLFVCTGNTCRSSMAAELARHLVRRLYPDQPVDVLSAGTLARQGDPASPGAVDALRERGLDLQGHCAVLLTPALLEQADLVLTMTGGHRQQVLQMFPQAAGRVFTLGDYAGTGEDVPDPIGSPLEDYRNLASLLEEMIKAALARWLGAPLSLPDKP